MGPDNTSLRDQLITDIRTFIRDDSFRRKSVTPNIGHTLVIATLFHEEEVMWSQFLESFEEESFLRRVFWWQKDRVPMNPEALFSASEISRNNILFQSLFKRIVIGIEDVPSTVISIDSTNSKLPEAIVPMLQEWKDLLVRTSLKGNWRGHFEELCLNGMSQRTGEFDVSELITRSIDKANTLVGYHYVIGGGYQRGGVRGHHQVHNIGGNRGREGGGGRGGGGVGR